MTTNQQIYQIITTLNKSHISLQDIVRDLYTMREDKKDFTPLIERVDEVVTTDNQAEKELLTLLPENHILLRHLFKAREMHMHLRHVLLCLKGNEEGKKYGHFKRITDKGKMHRLIDEANKLAGDLHKYIDTLN